MNPCEQSDRINKLDDESIPSWVRGAIFGFLMFILASIGGVYLHAQSTYATKEAVREIKSDIVKQLDRIEDYIRSAK